MKYIYTLLFIILFVSETISQNWIDLQKPEIIKDGTGLSVHDQAHGIFEDASGNLYQTGYFEGEITFGSTTLATVGNRDIFIAKVNKNGGWDWAVSAGGTSTDFSRDITCDNSGNIFITGYFYSTCYFGEHQVTAQNNSDVFVAKLSKNGEWLWANAGLGGGFNRSSAITCDNAGNSYITGSFESSISFGNTNLTSYGSRDIFIAKINSLGTWQWAVKAGGTGSEDGLGIKYNVSNVFLGITGYYSSNSTFGQIVLDAKGGRDIFVASLDTNGNWNWAVSAASTGAEESRSITIDGAGNSVITGYYTSALSFGDKNLPTGNGRDVYVAKIDKSGNWLWATNATGAGSDEANAIGLDNSGNAYITGWFSSDLKFGNTTINAESERNLFAARISSSGTWSWGRIGSGSSLVEGLGISVSSNGTTFITGYLSKDATFLNTTLNSLGESDIILARISSGGSWTWANSNGGVTGVVTGDGVAVDSSGNILYSGSFYGSVRFGDDTLRSNGGSDMYIAKFSPENGWIWAKSFGGTENDIAKSLATDGDDNVYVVGSFQKTVNFGGISRQSNGLTDAFIIKLSENGNIVWANSVGDYDSDQGVKVLCKNDYLLFSGNFSRRPFFGTVRLNSRGYDDIFLSKLDKDGNYLWTISAGSSQFDYVNDINIDIDENILMTGGFESTGYFGTNTVSSNGGDDIFIAKADSDGQWQWVRSAGTYDYQESGWGIDSDLEKNIYVVSIYRALCLYGSQYLVNKGLSDIALSKLDSSGNWIWSKEIGSSHADYAYALKYRFGRISIAGAVSNGFSINGKQFISNGLRNGFISNFDTNGDILWVKSDENNGTSEIKKIAIDDENIAYTIGNYSQNIKFGNFTKSEINSVDKNAFFASNGSTLEKPDWTFTDSTGKSAVVKIPVSISPKVNGRNLTQGDAIGVFYTRNNQFYCAGMEYWKGTDLEITVWGDNPNTPIKDGFFDNEQYSFKVWDVLKAEEVTCKVRYVSGPDKFADSAYSVILQLPIIYDTLKLQINQGWNMISSYCLPAVPSLDSIFYDISNNIAIVKSGLGNNYIPQFEINTIGNWSIKEGYQVYATQNTELLIIGDIVKSEDIVYNLNSGWHIISYTRSTPLDAVEAFASLVAQGKLVIAKSASGQNYIPEFDINTIGNLLPGQAYQIYLSGSAEFSYPAND